jgi:precorrin-2/cobalt-factor-2 C20-methyltransferase
MNKKLYMVSLGPGDAQLLTLKALNAFKECDAICVPTKSDDNSFSKSISYTIVKTALEILNIEKKIIPVYSPMRFIEEDWDNEAKVILNSLESHNTICFVTLGDAGVYSSIYYLLHRIKDVNESYYENAEVIAGVTSFSAASAKAKKALCLGDEELIIKPINPRKDIQTTTILMRPRIGMDTNELGDGNFYTFENLYLENEIVTSSKIKNVTKYMTLFINFAKRTK